MAGIPIADNLKKVNERIRAACRRAGRAESEVRLIAVSKAQSLEKVEAAKEAGQKLFGENYIQEAVEKKTLHPELEWHFIGALQTNKAKFAVGNFELIHAVDRPRVLQAISKHAFEKGIRQKILLEVNVAGEASKAGAGIEAAAELVRQSRQLPGVQLCGLMGMPPFADDPELSRPHFRKLRELFETWRSDVFRELSMGTSQDFEVAIEEGATLVRVGSEIFGARA